MNEHIQSGPPRPNPASDRAEYGAVELRKSRRGVPGWVWLLIALPLVLLLTCTGALVLGLLLHSEAPAPPARWQPMPAATMRVLPAPVPERQPDGQ
jgi:hypothetical protein